MLIYNLLRTVIYIIIFVISIFSKKNRLFFYKRLIKNNFNLQNINKEKILIHMSSVGEFNLSESLIEELLKLNNKIILSIVTDTGYSAIKKKYGDNKSVDIIYFPLDDYFLLKKLYKNNNIIKTIIIETEIWGNLYNIASKNGKLYIINGRITEKKLNTYMKFKNFICKTLNRAEKILVQSEKDRKRYLKLGVNSEKIICYNNLKYSIMYEKITEIKKNEYFEKYIFENKKIIVCGSTRDGEEEIWLNLFKKLDCDKYQLILVPRHVDRVEKIENIIKNLNLEYSKFSEEKRTDIIVVDIMGILRELYQIADYVFVGGTLVNIGGHSILEPLYYGKKPIIGKYYQNIDDIVEKAIELNYIYIVNDENDILNILINNEKIICKDFFEKNNDLYNILNEIE